MFQVGTFMGIAIHNLSTSDREIDALDLAAGVRQTASGLLGTTVQLADLVSLYRSGISYTLASSLINHH